MKEKTHKRKKQFEQKSVKQNDDDSKRKKLIVTDNFKQTSKQNNYFQKEIK